MVSVTEAKSILTQSCPLGPPTFVYLSESVDRISAFDVVAPIHVPSFDNAAMDGYALRWNGRPSQFKVVSTIAAGPTCNYRVKPGFSSRIFTGAPIPEGADTVIPQEFVKRNDDIISFDPESFFKGANIRTKGSQNIPGDVVLKKGSIITPGTIGLLASLGIAKIALITPPSVGVILTGNEIKEVGFKLNHGEIYNANGPILSSFLQKLGILKVEVIHVRDDPKVLKKTIETFIHKHDFTITSGGISVGEYDYVKSSMRSAGIEELFYKVKHKPGKPLFAGIKSDRLVFSLPGNPAAVITCFIQYVKPAILQWMGFKKTWLPSGYLLLENPFIGKNHLTHFLKSKKAGGKVTILPGQESFNLNTYGQANCMVEIPEGDPSPNTGDAVAVYDW